MGCANCADGATAPFRKNGLTGRSLLTAVCGAYCRGWALGGAQLSAIRESGDAQYGNGSYGKSDHVKASDFHYKRSTLVQHMTNSSSIQGLCDYTRLIALNPAPSGATSNTPFPRGDTDERGDFSVRTRIGTQGAVRVAFGTVVVKHVHAAVQSDRGKEHE